MKSLTHRAHAQHREVFSLSHRMGEGQGEGSGFPSLVLLLLLLLLLPSIHAFPPAPSHLFYGIVRDEYGNPLTADTAEIILEASSGAQVKTILRSNLEPGVNYRLAVPMDAGLTSDLYRPTALRPAVPFKIKVKIGSTVYLPIEMSGDFSKLGQAGERTLLNLTLGEDANGNGIPDAWELALIAQTGGKLTLKDIKPGDDLDHDGMSNLDEYLAGTYAFDDKDGFMLKIVRMNQQAAVLAFTAIRGRTYTIYGSTDLQHWTPVSFRLPGEGSDRQNYPATDVRLLQVEVVSPGGPSVPRYFKLMVQ